MKVNSLYLSALLLVLFFGYEAAAQNTELLQYNQERENITRTGMFVLGTWAVSNIAVGTVGYHRGTGENRYFHQMNALWNTVNLGLAGYSLLKAPAIYETLNPTLAEQNNIEKILLFNAALDAGYMMTGVYLRERANRSNNPQRMRGYGNSLLLQGGFLMAFDWALYLVLNNHSKSLHPIIEGLSFTGNALRFTYTF